MVIAWIVAGVVLLAVELHHFALYALFVAVGCFAAAIVAVLAPNATGAQIAAAVLVTVAGIVVVRPRVSQTLVRHGGHRGRGVHGGLVGHEVVAPGGNREVDTGDGAEGTEVTSQAVRLDCDVHFAWEIVPERRPSVAAPAEVP